MKKLSLYPGRFYKARNGEVWCCVSLELFREEHAQARCVKIQSERTEYFYRDGRYDTAGLREHTLVEEVVASEAVFE